MSIDGQKVMAKIDAYTQGMREINLDRIPLMEKLETEERKLDVVESDTYKEHYQDYLDSKIPHTKFKEIVRYETKSQVIVVRGIKSQISILNKKWDELIENLYLWKKLTFNPL